MKKILLISALAASLIGVIVFFFYKRKLVDPRDAVRYVHAFKRNWFEGFSF